MRFPSRSTPVPGSVRGATQTERRTSTGNKMLIEKLPTPRVGLLVRCKDTEAEAGRGTTNHRTSSSLFLFSSAEDDDDN